MSSFGKLVVLASLAITTASMVGQELAITTGALPVANVGQPYHAVLHATGGQPPYRWILGEKPLPPGLSLDFDSGEITGTPQAAGNSTFSVRLRDSSRPPQEAGADFTLHAVVPLQILTALMPPPQAGRPYQLRLQASGGSPPYHWKLAEGKLPPGLKLEDAGVIHGTPTQPGTFQLSLQLSDGDTPPQAVVRKFGIEVGALIEVRWITDPHLENGGVFGSLRVTNGSNRDFDLTVIVVAVNEIHKAFTLGHQHFVLPAKSVTQVIPFGFTLPRGTYEVRADAVGEVAATGQIFRAFAESGEGIQVP